MAHFEDCKFFRLGTCVNGLRCGYRHNEPACLTDRICNPWAAGTICDGRCNLRHPSYAELNALAATASSSKPNRSRVGPVTQDPAAARMLPAATQKQQFHPSSVVTGDPVGDAAYTAVPCKFHLQGRCAKGSACLFYHAPRAAEAGENALTLRGAAAATRAANAPRPAMATAAASPSASGREVRHSWTGRTGRSSAAVENRSGDAAPDAAAAAAMAKERAAAIMQRHRVSKSVSAMQAGSKGGLEIRATSKPIAGKRPRADSGSSTQRLQPTPKSPRSDKESIVAAVGDRDRGTNGTARSANETSAARNEQADPENFSPTDDGGERHDHGTDQAGAQAVDVAPAIETKFSTSPSNGQEESLEPIVRKKLSDVDSHAAGALAPTKGHGEEHKLSTREADASSGEGSTPESNQGEDVKPRKRSPSAEDRRSPTLVDRKRDATCAAEDTSHAPDDEQHSNNDRAPAKVVVRRASDTRSDNDQAHGALMGRGGVGRDARESPSPSGLTAGSSLMARESAPGEGLTAGGST